jgi:hypothetical protein
MQPDKATKPTKKILKKEIAAKNKAVRDKKIIHK